MTDHPERGRGHLRVAFGALSRGWLLAWLLYPAAAIALALLFTATQTSANPLFRLRFQLSQTALHDAARRALARTPQASSFRVGLFRIERTDVHEGEVLRHLGGPWYHLYASF